jgi:UPF0042 nucleotide-binding protein
LNTVHFVVVTGLSGSGKSTAIRALEDIGFFCVDNLPVVILDKLLVLAEAGEKFRRVALGIDAREREFLDAFAETLARIRALGHTVDVVFLDTSDDVLYRRFSETRRRHPLEAEAGTLTAGIARERDILARVREQASWSIDTSDLSVHQLKAAVQQAYDPHRGGRMAVTIKSFGFRNGTPREADYVFDCRFLPNPYFEPVLRPLDGRDAPIRDFLAGRPEWAPFQDRLRDFLDFVLPLHEAEGKPTVTLAFGCTGGRHRSVAVSETVAAFLRPSGRNVTVVHRDMDAWSAAGSAAPAGASRKRDETGN